MAGDASLRGTRGSLKTIRVTINILIVTQSSRAPRPRPNYVLSRGGKLFPCGTQTNLKTIRVTIKILIVTNGSRVQRPRHNSVLNCDGKRILRGTPCNLKTIRVTIKIFNCDALLVCLF